MKMVFKELDNIPQLFPDLEKFIAQTSELGVPILQEDEFTLLSHGDMFEHDADELVVLVFSAWSDEEERDLTDLEELHVKKRDYYIIEDFINKTLTFHIKTPKISTINEICAMVGLPT